MGAAAPGGTLTATVSARQREELWKPREGPRAQLAPTQCSDRLSSAGRPAGALWASEADRKDYGALR